MAFLYEIIQQNVAGWRSAGSPGDDYPAIAEILDYARLPDGETLRFLRRAQLRALETYCTCGWSDTPHIFDLCRRYYPKPLDLLAALGLDREKIKDFVLYCNLGLAQERAGAPADAIGSYQSCADLASDDDQRARAEEQVERLTEELQSSSNP